MKIGETGEDATFAPATLSTVCLSAIVSTYLYLCRLRVKCYV